MARETVIAELRSHEKEIRALGARSLFLFGSVLQGTARKNSDVDLFIDYYRNRKFSLIDLMRLKYFLEALLGNRVDLLTRDGIHRRLRDRIIADAVKVF
ncbi:MAG TPA: nucleotidyltransferase domain-containing protein [Alphaproteobacteria bacterium]